MSKACIDEGCPHFGKDATCEPKEGGCIATLPKPARTLAEVRSQPIVTNFVFPPIPRRDFDWNAYRDPESLYGAGATEKEAIASLLEQEEEHYS